jgi:iron complex outermembrane receptor protein
MIRLPLAALLAGTALCAFPAWAETDAQTDDSIVVIGSRPRSEASAGTKGALPIAETPQSISVVSSADIADLGLSNLNQALRFVAGVTTEQRGSSAEVYDQFKLRGFDAPQFLDGLKLSGGAGYLAPQIDVSRLDRIEVVKGPASVLYGQSGPGGLVALASKLPLDRSFYGAASATYGTFDLYRVDGDVGGRTGNVLWRVYASANGAHTEQTFSARERQTVSGAVTIGQGSATTLTLLGAYSHDPQNGSYGVFPQSGVFETNPNGPLPTSRDFGERDNFFRRNQLAGTYILTHDFGSGWSLRASGRYSHATSSLGIVYASGSLLATDPTQRTYNRASYATQEHGNSGVFDHQLHGTLKTGDVKHDLLFGVDYQTGKAYEHYAFGGATPLNGYAPVYGTMAVPRTPETVPGNFGVGTIRPSQTQTGVYGQDQISWGGLRVLLSGRQDWATDKAGPGVSSAKSRKFTYRAGALYTTSIGLAPYVSYSTSFEPQGTFTTAAGSVVQAKPSLGKQIEAGVKYSVPGDKILVTGAWFQIDQTNVITYLPNFTATQNGKVRSSGVEIEANAELPLDFRAKLAFSRQKVRVTQDAIAANIGNGILGVGRGGTTFNLEWAPKDGKLKGFAIGGAVRQVDSVYAGTYTPSNSGAAQPRTRTAGFTIYDAQLRYDLGNAMPSLAGVSLAISAQNLFDKKYVTTCYLDYGWCWFGNRRTVQGTIAYKF